MAKRKLMEPEFKKLTEDEKKKYEKDWGKPEKMISKGPKKTKGDTNGKIKV